MRFPFAMLVALSITACSEGTPSTPEPDPGPEPAESGPRYITLDGDALETARAAIARRDPDAKLDVVDMWNGVAVVRYDAQDFKALSQEMHENHNRCGGFILHDSLDDALVALRAKDNEGLAPLIAYTIDNGATVNALLPQLNQTSLLGVIQQLSSYPTRYYTSTTGVQAANWLRDQWTTWAAGRSDVSVQLYTHPTWAQPSVIATITGTTLPSEVVVVGGHLDSINGATGSAPGADDDASGIATLSEVYRVLMTTGYRPARTVKFMAYAAEEVGLRGSAAIAAEHQANSVNVVGVMQLDMTNYKGSTGDIYLYTDYTNPTLTAFTGQLFDTYLPGLVRGSDACGYGCSDHASWHNRGYPAVLPFESRMSQYNPTIHTANDTLAQSGNNASHAIKFAKLAAAFVAEVAKGQIGAPSNTPPTVTINAPANGSTYTQGASVGFSGTASDAQDGSVSGSIQWTSSLDGAIGTGASFSRVLTVGSHTITASVTDSGGMSGQAQISVTVTGTAINLFSDSFEGTNNNWSPTGLWHLVTNSTCASPGYSSATNAMYYGQNATCNYSTGARTTGQITSPLISGVQSTSTLRFKYYRRVESASGSYDVASVQVVTGTATTTIWSRTSANASNTLWNDSGALSLSAYAGQSIQIRFKFDSMDSYANAYTGWLIDDIVVAR